MKLQYLILIFLLIMTPIYLVFSKYVDVQVNNINIQNTYDSRLQNATYDAVKAFQTNTLNFSKYAPESRVKFSKASVNAFYTALNLAFGFNGENNKVMNEYVPAVVLTMYDGYYIYSPFVNKLPDVDNNDVDEEYEKDKTISDLKPYVTYSCNYSKDANTNYIITYSLDNYIIVDEFRNVNDVNNGYHKRHEGYLIGLKQYENIGGTLDYEDPSKIISFKFNGIEFSNNKTEMLKEYLINEDGKTDENGKKGYYYYYTIRNGTKYYYGTTDDKGNIIGPGNISQTIDPNNTRDVIFYIDDSGARMKQCENYRDNIARFGSYLNEIKKNNLAFKYYRDAYVFSSWVENNLQGLNAGNENSSIKNSANYDGYEFTHIDNIFGEINSDNTFIEDSDSKFNQHRRDVIRAVIQTNLSTAISGFSIYSKADENINFIMPKISEEDWDLLENKSCIATFLQGFPIGSTSNTYNNYVVIPNNKTKEFVDEENIYVIKSDNTYAKINEKDYTLASSLGHYPAMWNISFEPRQLNGNTYMPTSYKNGDEYIPYLQSYSSMMGTDLESYIEIYKYIRQKGDSDKAIKEAYYVALGRERKGTFKFTNYDDIT